MNITPGPDLGTTGSEPPSDAWRPRPAPRRRRVAGCPRPDCDASARIPRPRPRRTIIVKFRVERDVLADAVAWAARSLRSGPALPVLAGLLIEASDEGLMLSTFDYETSARATLHGRGGRRGPGAGLRPAARRHLPQPARQAGRDGARRRQGLADLRLRAVQPADDAGRGLPDAARDAGRDRHRAERRVRPRRRPGRHRRRPRRHAPGAHRRPDRDRRLDDLAAGHRPVPALPARARLEPAQPRRVAAPRWSRPGCSPTPPSR